MPAKRSSSRARSKSVGRPRSRSRSRARSKSRGRSPGRKAKQSPSPSRVIKRTATPKKEAKPKIVKTPSTPTRQSSRLVEKTIVKEQLIETEKSDRAKRASNREEKKAAVTAKARKYEFGGPLGVSVLIVGLPTLILLINLACGKECTLKKLPALPRTFAAYFDRDATLLYLGWLSLQVILALLPIGRVVPGQTLKSGKKLSYRCNGFFSLLVSLSLFAVLVYLKFPVEKVYDKMFPMAVTAILFSFVLSVACFIRARKLPPSQISATGNTGSVVYDFFMGRELNPRFGSFDLKFVCELRPGLIGWMMLNLVFVSKACHETSGSPNPALLLVAALQMVYVAEALWFEDAILTTMDITHDGFGYMIALGDLAWVPFLYCLQGKFLLEHPQEWSALGLAAIFALNLIGYIIFRGSNSQKNRFRKNPYDPSLAHLETLPTPTGKRLLVSGWWGMCRHPNYFGDLIMALAWSLPCGFSHALPYFYPLYFLFLLVDRARRDDAICRQKYGAAWESYCQRVPYVIFPYIY